MLKPQLYIPNGWVGDINFSTEEDWLKWEESYQIFINFFINIAKKYDVEMVCIGTEIKQSINHRPSFWRQLTRSTKQSYKGKLIYSANWDNYENITVWDELDYIGISGYFPLSNQKTPPVRQLEKAWLPIKKRLRKIHKTYQKQILFTEFGYMSVDGCAGKAWEIEREISRRDVNEHAQANAYEAFYKTHWKESYFAGSFLWKWFPAKMGHEGYFQKDYTPQTKLSSKVLYKWFRK